MVAVVVLFALGGQRDEAPHVAPDALIQRQDDGLAVGDKEVVADARPQRREGTAKSGAGTVLPVLGIQKRRQLIARADTVGAANDKICQCSYRLARVQFNMHAAAFDSWWAKQM